MMCGVELWARVHEWKHRRQVRSKGYQPTLTIPPDYITNFTAKSPSGLFEYRIAFSFSSVLMTS